MRFAESPATSPPRFAPDELLGRRGRRSEVAEGAICRRGCVYVIADRFERHARFQIAGNWAARFRVNAVVQDTRCGAGPSTPTMQIQLPSIRRLPKRELFVTPSPAMSARRVRSEQLSGRDGAEQRASGPECRCHID